MPGSVLRRSARTGLGVVEKWLRLKLGQRRGPGMSSMGILPRFLHPTRSSQVPALGILGAQSPRSPFAGQFGVDSQPLKALAVEQGSTQRAANFLRDPACLRALFKT